MDWQFNIPCEGKDNVGIISRMEGMWDIDIAKGNQIDLNNLFLSVRVFTIKSKQTCLPQVVVFKYEEKILPPKP